MSRIIQLSELIADTRFGEQLSVREFVQPNTYSVLKLYQSIAHPGMTNDEVILACWEWIQQNIKYSFSDKYQIKGGAGVNRVTQELWELPGETLAWKVGDCDASAILLCSLLRNRLSPSDIYVVVGDLHTDSMIGGHAWCIAKRANEDFVIESTLRKMPPNPWHTSHELKERYHPRVYFNDKEIWASSSNLTLLQERKCNIQWMNDLWCGCEI